MSTTPWDGQRDPFIAELMQAYLAARVPLNDEKQVKELDQKMFRFIQDRTASETCAQCGLDPYYSDTRVGVWAVIRSTPGGPTMSPYAVARDRSGEILASIQEHLCEVCVSRLGGVVFPVTLPASVEPAQES